MSISFFLSILLLLLPFLVLSELHLISLPPSSLRPSTLAWDPISTHFVVGSATSHAILAVSDAGVVEHLISEPSGPTSSVSSLAVDSVRRRLIVGFSNPASVAAYELKSGYKRLFVAEVEGEIGGVAVDLGTGEVFVSGAERAVVWRIGLGGEVRVFSEFRKYGDEGLGGIVHVSSGYLLVVQPATGKFFKVDSEDGAIKEVLPTANQLVPHGTQHLSLNHDHSLLVSSNKTLQILKSDDSWAQAGVQDKLKLESTETAVAVAVRDGKVGYVLVERESGEFRIEEIEWRRNEGDLLWGLGLLGLGFVYFLVWRFQMGKLVSGMSKKQN
ncbi:hypothetical protein LUZ60_008271 [Juncus effusus]|nr:hypothetical protein LUZ60_008271 [Juncus effusus]